MKFRCIFLLLVCCIGNAAAFNEQEVQNLFEWGEYRQLIDSLAPELTTGECRSDSGQCARYHCFLGVAYFGTGRVGEAQEQFRKALSLDPDIRPDSMYLSTELNGLFATIRADFLEKLRRVEEKDSLLRAEKEAFNANLRAIRSEAQRKSRRAGAVIAGSLYLLSGAIAAIAAFEYRDTQPTYTEFMAAAEQGDKIAYQRLKPVIRRANYVAGGCTAGASLSMAAAITISIRSVLRR